MPKQCIENIELNIKQKIRPTDVVEGDYCVGRRGQVRNIEFVPESLNFVGANVNVRPQMQPCAKICIALGNIYIFKEQELADKVLNEEVMHLLSILGEVRGSTTHCLISDYIVTRLRNA